MDICRYSRCLLLVVAFEDLQDTHILYTSIIPIRDMTSERYSRHLGSLLHTWKHSVIESPVITRRCPYTLRIHVLPHGYEPLFSGCTSRGSPCAKSNTSLEVFDASYSRARRNPCMSNRVAGSAPVDSGSPCRANRDHGTVRTILLQDVPVLMLPVALMCSIPFSSLYWWAWRRGPDGWW